MTVILMWEQGPSQSCELSLSACIGQPHLPLLFWDMSYVALVRYQRLSVLRLKKAFRMAIWLFFMIPDQYLYKLELIESLV